MRSARNSSDGKIAGQIYKQIQNRHSHLLLISHLIGAVRRSKLPGDSSPFVNVIDANYGTADSDYNESPSYKGYVKVLHGMLWDRLHALLFSFVIFGFDLALGNGASIGVICWANTTTTDSQVEELGQILPKCDCLDSPNEGLERWRMWLKPTRKAGGRESRRLPFIAMGQRARSR